MAEEETVTEAKKEKAVDEAFCSSCGEVIKKEAEICPKCGVRQKSASAFANEKYAVPAILSFFLPGLGQIIKKEVGKGIVIMLAIFASLLLMLVGIGFLTYPIIWIWSVYDAYTCDV